MSVKIGINGFGRIGRLVLRASLENPDVEVVESRMVIGGGCAPGASLPSWSIRLNTSQDPERVAAVLDDGDQLVVEAPADLVGEDEAGPPVVASGDRREQRPGRSATEIQKRTGIRVAVRQGEDTPFVQNAPGRLIPGPVMNHVTNHGEGLPNPLTR